MLQMLISTARAVMVIGVLVSVLSGAIFGFAMADASGLPGLVGILIGGGLGFIGSSVAFGVAAAVFDIQEQTRIIASHMRRQGTDTTAEAPGAEAIVPVAAEATPTIEDAKPAYRFREGPEGWELLIAEAKAQGWKVSNGLTGVTFTHPKSGERIKCHTVREAEQALGLN